MVSFLPSSASVRCLSRAWLVAFVAAVALVVVLSSVPPVAAEPTEAVVLVPSGTFHVGDMVMVTIRVFSYGIAVDPTDLTVYISGATVDRNLAYSRQGTGTFTSTFQIESGDLAGLTFGGTTDRVGVEVNATVGGAEGYGSGWITVWALPQPLEVVLSVPQELVLPGGTVPINATVSSDGVLVDPDTLAVLVSLGTSVYNVPVPMTRITTGRYSGSYVVPAGTRSYVLLTITGEVTLGNLTAYAPYQLVKLGVPPFTVWQHVREIAPSYVLVDIVVANDTGWPVVGANVSLYYPAGQCHGDGCQTPRWVYATTDRLGAAAFNLSVPGPYATTDLLFNGTVRMGPEDQPYVGGFSRLAPYYPYRDFCPSDGLLSFAPGGTVRRMYHGLCFGIVNATFYYYAYSAQAMVANGSVRADAQGNFNLTFTAPSEGVSILLDTYVNQYLDWVRFRDFLLVADPGITQVANLSIGRVAQITVDMPNVGGSVAFVPYNATNVVNPEYSGWTPLPAFPWPETIPAVPGAPFRANLTLPRFLPKDQDYLLTVTANQALSTRGYVYSKVVHMTNVPPTAAATFSTLNPVEGEAIRANASGSRDPDGIVVAYNLDCGDGSSTGWMNDYNATHVYASPGTYTATAQVRDDSGAQNTTTYTVPVEASILGVRASTFYLAVLAVALVAVAVVAVAVYVRRDRPERHQPLQPSVTPPPPEAPRAPEEGPPRPPGSR